MRGQEASDQKIEEELQEEGKETGLGGRLLFTSCQHWNDGAVESRMDGDGVEEAGEHYQGENEDKSEHGGKFDAREDEALVVARYFSEDENPLPVTREGTSTFPNLQFVLH